jgi:hypothetical protein
MVKPSPERAHVEKLKAVVLLNRFLFLKALVNSGFDECRVGQAHF